MKKQFITILALVYTLLFASCASDSANSLLQSVPDDTDVVAVINIKNIVESTGGSISDGKIKLPSSLTDSFDEIDSDINKSLDKVNELIKDAAVDPSAVAVMVNFREGEPIIVFKVTDRKKFIDYLDDEKFREKDSDGEISFFTKLTDEYSWGKYYSLVAINGDIVYMMDDIWCSDGEEKALLRSLQKICDKAKESNFSTNPICSFIASGNAGGVSVKIPREARSAMRELGVESSELEFLNGYIAFTGSLEGDNASVNMKFFDEDGKEKDLQNISTLMDFSAKIDPKALEYMDKDECIIYALTLKDINWDEYMDMIAKSARMSFSDRAKLSVAKNYLKKFDGTVALGLGLKGGLDAIYNIDFGKAIANQFSATLVVQTAPDQAKGLMDDLKGFMKEQGVPFEDIKSGFTLDLNGFIVNGIVDGNFIIVSNGEIKAYGNNPVAKEINFSDCFAALGFVMNQDNELMRDLNLKYDLKCEITSNLKKNDFCLKAQIKGGKDKGIIAKGIRIALDIMAQEDDLENRYDKARDAYYMEKYGKTYNQYYDSWSYDYSDDYWGDSCAVVEEVVVEEDW